MNSKHFDHQGRLSDGLQDKAEKRLTKNWETKLKETTSTDSLK